jgi:hypothetical protein
MWTGISLNSFTCPIRVLDAAMQSNAAAGLPAIDVAPNQGKFLNLLARLTHL